MKISNHWLLLLLISGFFAAGCTPQMGKKDDNRIGEEALGLRSTDLYSENNTSADSGHFSSQQPGQSELIERSFENAPPLIPHTTEGFLPIKTGQNMCLSCHMPEVAKLTRSTPVPKSHLMDFRPEITEQNGVVKTYADDEHGNTVTTEDLGGQLSNTRYNCSQCHVPQADITVNLRNEFRPEFREEGLKNRSNFSEVVQEGVK